ncbi:MAG: hypothetical protein ACLP3R_13970 [Candidatus Korobacteraceae bacterium]
MTDQEKLEQRVRLGIEVETAKQNLAHDRENALALADDLQAWAKWLRGQAGREPSASDFDSGRTVQDMAFLADERHKKCLNFDTLLRAEESLREARTKASNMELRKMQLESPATFTNR